MAHDTEIKSLQIRDDGFQEIAQTVLRAVNEVATGVNKIAADSILSSVKEAYLKGYHDGYREAMRRVYADQASDDSAE